jgi:hypothetical protein
VASLSMQTWPEHKSTAADWVPRLRALGPAGDPGRHTACADRRGPAQENTQPPAEDCAPSTRTNKAAGKHRDLRGKAGPCPQTQFAREGRRISAKARERGVAAGTDLTSRSPRRSGRAGLPHPALASGHGVEAHARPTVHDLRSAHDCLCRVARSRTGSRALSTPCSRLCVRSALALSSCTWPSAPFPPHRPPQTERARPLCSSASRVLWALRLPTTAHRRSAALRLLVALRVLILSRRVVESPSSCAWSARACRSWAPTCGTG